MTKPRQPFIGRQRAAQNLLFRNSVKNTDTHEDHELEHPAIIIALVGFLFFGGIAVGIAATCLLAPNSETAAFVSFLMLPVSFGFGMVLWYGMARAITPRLLGRALVKSLRTRELYDSIREELTNFEYRTFSGTRIFVPITVGISFIAGCIVSCCPTAGEFEVVITTYTSIGLAYSMLVTIIFS